MTPGEVRAFIDSRPGWIALTTLSKDGYPHTVPIGYFRVDEDLYIGCRARTQKTLNVARNPRVSLMLEAGTTMAGIRGVIIQGDAEVIEEPARLLELARAAARWRGLPESQWPVEPSPGAAYIHVTPRKVISWDYRPGPAPAP